MADDRDLEVSTSDIESLAEKLDAFAPSLSGNEREILSHVIRVAAQQAEAEVTGFALSEFRTPLASMLGRGVSATPTGATIPGAGQSGYPDLNPGGIRAKN